MSGNFGCCDDLGSGRAIELTDSANDTYSKEKEISKSLFNIDIDTVDTHWGGSQSSGEQNTRKKSCGFITVQ